MRTDFTRTVRAHMWGMYAYIRYVRMCEIPGARYDSRGSPMHTNFTNTVRVHMWGMYAYVRYVYIWRYVYICEVCTHM